MADLGGFIQGAGGGALGGFGIGGPIGGLVGGVLGGLGGLFGGGEEEKNRKMMTDYYNEVRRRGTPSISGASTADYSGFRRNQSNLISNLEALSQGRGPSLAAEQFKRSTDRNVAQQQGLALSGQGNATAAAMGAANNSAQLGAQATQDAGVARMQEQLGALNQLGLTIHGARGMDEDVNKFNANERNQIAIQNLDAQLRARGLDDAARLQILGNLQGAAATPSMGERILAGGAGLFSQAATNRAMSRGFGNGGYQPMSAPARGFNHEAGHGGF